MISVKPDIDQAVAWLKNLERNEIPKVVGRTLNRVGSSARSQSSRALRKRINLKKAVIDQAITLRRGSRNIGSLAAIRNGEAWFELQWSGRPFPLRDFDAREVSRGVSFKVGKASRRHIYIREGRKGFIVKSRGGHVFVRVGPNPPGKKGAPIEKVWGPSIPQFAVTKREMRDIIEHVNQYWATELERNVRFAISRRTSS